MSEELNVYQKLNNAQLELKSPKGQYNKFGKFNYRSAEDILESVKPINHKHKLNLKLTDKPIMVGDRIYIEAKAVLTNVDNPDEEITLKAYARESLNKKGMDDSQITGTASSYARKYCLNGLYLIDDTKDADTDEYRNNIDNAPKVKKITKKQSDELVSLIKEFAEVSTEDGADIKMGRHIAGNYATNGTKVKDIDRDNFNTVKNYLKGMIKQNTPADQPEQQSLTEGNTTTAKKGS